MKPLHAKQIAKELSNWNWNDGYESDGDEISQAVTNVVNRLVAERLAFILSGDENALRQVISLECGHDNSILIRSVFEDEGYTLFGKSVVFDLMDLITDNIECKFNRRHLAHFKKFLIDATEKVNSALKEAEEYGVTQV